MTATSDYVPGVCNIGGPEVAARRRAGHLASVATLALAGLLLGTRASRPARLLLAVPAAGAASGYIQARSRFCAGFGSRGVTNFGELGSWERVVDDEARAADRARSRRIGLQSLGIGVAVAAAALALPAPRR